MNTNCKNKKYIELEENKQFRCLKFAYLDGNRIKTTKKQGKAFTMHRFCLQFNLPCTVRAYGNQTKTTKKWEKLLQ